MAKAFVSLGSNIDPEKNIRLAVRLLAAEVTLIAVSTVYLTDPIGSPGQPPYYNCVIRIETDLSPLLLKRGVLRRIEEQLGRNRTPDKFAPRTIDLDLILYDDVVLAETDLTLPDPDILRRSFLIAGLYELQQDLVLPDGEIPIANLKKNTSADQLTALSAYTSRLREELHHGS